MKRNFSPDFRLEAKIVTHFITFFINISVIFASYYFFSRLTTYYTCFSVTVFNNVFKANFLGHSSCKPLSFELELRPYR